MDTQQPTPTPEQQPAPMIRPEQMPAGPAHEHAPQPAAGGAAQQNAGAGAGAPPAKPLTAADVAAAIAAMPTPGAPVPVTSAPTNAADQDVVEPEWVDAAEKTIQQTAGNPYAEEEAVEALQIDYLKKRYGYEVKKPEDT